MIDVSKIKQYNVFSLAHIAGYKVLYKVYLRLFRCFAPSDWSQIRGKSSIILEQTFVRFFSMCDSNREQIIEEADNIIAGRIVLFGNYFDIDSANGWLTDPVSKKEWNRGVYFVSAPVKQEGLGDVKYVLELNKFNHIVRVALAFHYTHDDKYIDYINSSIIGYRKTIKPYKSVCQRIIMDAGFRIINLIQVMMLCTDSIVFKERCCPLINGIIYDQVNAIRRFHTAKWFKTGNGNNHVTGEMVGAIVGTLWLEYCGIHIRKCYRQYMHYLIEVLDRTISPSGAYLEQSDNYARLVAEFLVFFDLFSDSFPSKSLNLIYYKKHSYTERLLQYLSNISYYDQLPNFGDNDDARVLLAWRPQGHNVDYLIKGLKRNSQSYLDGSTWIYRSEDKNDVYLYTRVGRFAYFKEATRIHSHNDLLSLVMGINGQMIFVDKGCYLYNQGPNILMNDRAYSSHNTASIDGLEIDVMQSNGSFLQYPYSTCSMSEINNGECRFEGELVYYGVKQTRKVRYSDSCIYIRDRFEGNGLNKRHGTIKYILHKDLHVELKDNEVVVKGLTKNPVLLRIMIDGVDDVRLEKETYAPSFATKEETTAIVASFVAIAGKEYVTSILIN